MDDIWKLTTPGKGIVQIRNFDQGLILSMGAILKLLKPTDAVKTYVLETGDCAGDVPIYFSSGDPAISYETVPRIVVTRSSEDDAGQRLHPGHIQWEDRWDDSPQISGSDFFEEYEQSYQAWPYDITYDLDIRATTRNQSNSIWNYIMANSTVKPKGYMSLRDSANDLRTYDVLFDSIGNADEMDDINQRFIGLSVTLRVLGEIDILSNERFKTVKQSDITVVKK